MRLFSLVFATAISVLWGGAATAQWVFNDTGSEARAYVIGQRGTMLGFRCSSQPEHRQELLMDLRVRPSTTEPDAEEVAHFQIGTWTFDVETVPDGALRTDGTQAYLSRFDYDHPVIQNLRRQIASGSRVVFTRTFDFQAMSFGLGGSRTAMTRLDTACHRLWRGGTAGAAGPAPVAGRWRVEQDGDTMRAIIRGANSTYFGLECNESHSEQATWIFQVAVTSPLIIQTPVTITLDGTRYPVFPQAFAGMQMVDGIMPYAHMHQPDRHAGILQRFAGGVSRISFPGGNGLLPASFTGAGASEALETVLDHCGLGAGSATEGAGDPPAVSDPPPDWALASLETYVASVVQAQCAAGSIPQLPDNTFRVEGDRVFVRLGFADCDWRFGLNPYCGSQLCAVWEYRYTDETFDLVGNTLR